MSNADVILAVSEQELTSLSQQTYDAAYPQIFTRTVPYTFEGTNFPIEVDVQAAPVFDLSPSDAAKQAVINALSERIKPAHIEALDVERSTAFLEQQVPNCSVRFPKILITIKTPDLRDAVLTLVDITAYCYVQVTNDVVTVVPTALTAAHQTDPLYDVLVQKALLPELKSLLTNYLAGLSLPPILIEGIALSPLSASIENGHLVAAANLAAKGAPLSPSGVLWVDAGFSVLLSMDALQAAAIVGLKKEQSSLHDQGRQESWGFGYYWSYSLFPGTPQVALSNTDLALTLPVTANVQAGGIVFWQHIGVNYNAIVQPTPHALFSVVVLGNQVHMTFKSMNTVVILLEPTGSISEHILSWMLAGIANAVSASGSAALTTFVKNIPFPVLTIPTLSPTIEGVTFHVVPSNLRLSNFTGQLAVGGAILVKKG
jgi:hypothetical protein